MVNILSHAPVRESDRAPSGLDTGLGCVLGIAHLHGIAADEATLRHKFALSEIFGAEQIVLAARSIGLKGKVVQQAPARLAQAPLPAVAMDLSGKFFIVAKYTAHSADAGACVLIQHPGSAPQVITEASLFALWTGDLIYFTSALSISGDLAKFDFSWFIPAVIKYRKLLGEVLLISLVLQLIGLVTPMFFQVVMDKVLVNHAMQTLNVITLGLVCATVFEAVLTGIRTYVFSQTSSKIDVELGARLFQHLLNLPLAYFQSRRVGDSVARVRELENIRTFLTGNAITLVLDLLFSFVFILVMLCYSADLTLIVLVSIPLYGVLSLTCTPILRARLTEKFNRGAENQSFLVETLHGIDTIKAMAVEPRWQQRWERQLAGYVSAGLAATNIAMVANGGVSLINKLVTAAIMWYGAKDVVGGSMSVGELVAFNMLASHISSPILRLAQVWNDFQQVGISMQRLGDILNTPAETRAQQSPMPQLAGAIRFDQVSFRYRADGGDVLRKLDLVIAAGEVIGIVGRSGSGKSTLTKLVQRLYAPYSGRILIDRQDIAISDSVSLRHQIGVVLQENTLFARSIRDNIALSNPSTPIDEVIGAAKLAGAHDFICELPNGYDTQLGEHGTGLSGGQRQRIAIARALITNPRILIFDEATSALDYESEKIIQDNMRDICVGRTVLIIAHRLSAVRDADRILVMERGQIAEIGSHQELLNIPSGLYASLHRLQESHACTPHAAMPAAYTMEATA
ncbi:type I secretion system permease/ATPase [Duganella sp. FT109W]|uniref:Type I secretion system permease/ATPase n=1 Tax=Duganella margarita TaxID=2692170 RepID=A0ABW9WJV6_9BURK|nr:type I secretion system permease/ATPase [Duganella margarita]MYN40370.1 type I secretion system permease/ATPase [Duganella margarita]